MNIGDLIVTPLRRVPVPAGDVLHGMKNSDPGFAGFGEAYFSIVLSGEVKGWKRHNQVTLNFVVPAGKILIRILDELNGQSRDFLLGPDNTVTYQRITIPPGLWVAFGGIGEGLNLLLNLASQAHDPLEADNRPLTSFPWNW